MSQKFKVPVPKPHTRRECRIKAIPIAIKIHEAPLPPALRSVAENPVVPHGTEPSGWMLGNKCVLQLQRGGIQNFNISRFPRHRQIWIEWPPYRNNYVSCRCYLDFPDLRFSFLERQVIGRHSLQWRGIKIKHLAGADDKVPVMRRQDAA